MLVPLEVDGRLLEELPDPNLDLEPEVEDLGLDDEDLGRELLLLPDPNLGLDVDGLDVDGRELRLLLLPNERELPPPRLCAIVSSKRLVVVKTKQTIKAKPVNFRIWGLL